MIVLFIIMAVIAFVMYACLVVGARSEMNLAQEDKKQMKNRKEIDDDVPREIVQQYGAYCVRVRFAQKDQPQVEQKVLELILQSYAARKSYGVFE